MLLYIHILKCFFNDVLHVSESLVADTVLCFLLLGCVHTKAKIERKHLANVILLLTNEMP